MSKEVTAESGQKNVDKSESTAKAKLLTMAEPFAENEAERKSDDEGDTQKRVKPGLLSMASPYAIEGDERQSQTKTTSDKTAEKNQITQATLEDHWEKLWTPENLATFSEPEKKASFLKGVKPELDADGKTVVITLTSSFAEHEVKKEMPEIMSRLRHYCGCQELTPKIVIKAEERAAKPYQSGEKYEAMMKINPELASLRKILPDIDI